VREFANAGTESAREIQEWLVSYLAVLLDLDVETVDIDDTFASFGLDSSAAMGMVGDLEEWLERKLDPEVIYNHPTIATLSKYLADTGVA
jgi:acyl carrier protein